MSNPITAKDIAQHRATPGSLGGKVVQAPLATKGPRDALIADGKQAFDYVPDVERLHVGFVPQPVVPIRNSGGDIIGYAAADDLRDVLGTPAAPVTLLDLKDAHNAREGSAEWQRHIRPVGAAPLGEEASALLNAKAAAKAPEPKVVEPTPKQQAVAEAEALGISTEGTEAEIRERIAEHQAAVQIP